ncbi:stalk domain-containing protein [Cohnella sp. WQ 127256]|uniref:stalk domain-containing protein n=1 Tax=Cohnella sp. WQ 127256 TaxID=2938790 RepID=UPI0021192594|nr:stalk domain-containing protein [Cohnella sp. WQ 127256]
MLLKKASIVSVLALAVGVSAVGAASAATVTKASAVQVSDSTYIVNGISVNLKTFFEKNKTIVSVRDLGVSLGASFQVTKDTIQLKLNSHTVELKLNSNVINVDGAEQQLTVPVKSVAGTTYVELKASVEALGAHFAKDASGTTWIDANLLANVDQIQWVDATRFIASQENESGRADFLVDAQTGKYKQLRISEGASELVVAPNGEKAAYTSASGEIYVISFGAYNAAQVSEDNSIKTELVWSADSSSIYFLQGDKGSVIAKLDPRTKGITKIVDDKVDYKANLEVSTDGKSFTYTVTKPGAVVADSSKPVESDDVAIDMKGTEPQIYLFTVDPSVKDNKAVKLTSTADDKVFIHASPDTSSVSYVSISNDDDAKSILNTVGKDAVVKTLFKEKDVYQATLSGGKWYLLTEGSGTNNFVYSLDPATGAAVQLYTLSDSVTEIVVKEGAPFAVINNGRVFLDINGHWKPTSL